MARRFTTDELVERIRARDRLRKAAQTAAARLAKGMPPCSGVKAKLTTNERLERQRAASKRYYDANREKSLARVASYKAANPDKVKAYVEAHRNKASAASMAWAKANPERHAATAKRHACTPARMTRHLNLTAEQRAGKVQAVLRWQAKNPESVRAVTSNRRAKIKQQGRLSRGIVKRLMLLQKSSCANCAINLKIGYHVDHVEPLARGGLNIDTNIQLLCPTCNMKKGAKDPFVWANKNGRLL